MNISNGVNSFFATCTFVDISVTRIREFPSKNYRFAQIALLVINIILLLSTISLNGISIITIRKSPQLGNKVCYFVILLQSVVDLFVGLLTIPLTFYYSLSPFLKDPNCALIVLTFRTPPLPCGLSIVTLSAMTMERYMGVLYPYQYQTTVTKRRIFVFVAGSGFVVFSAVVSSFYDQQVMLYFIRVFISVFLLFTSFAYTRIYLEIWKLIRSEAYPAGASEERQRKKKVLRARRHATSCFLIVVSFFLLLFPVILVPVFLTVDSFHHAVYFNWSVTLVILNSTVNSVIFFWTKTLLRKEALKTLKSLCS